MFLTVQILQGTGSLGYRFSKMGVFEFKALGMDPIVAWLLGLLLSAEFAGDRRVFIGTPPAAMTLATQTCFSSPPDSAGVVPHGQYPNHQQLCVTLLEAPNMMLLRAHPKKLATLTD